MQKFSLKIKKVFIQHLFKVLQLAVWVWFSIFSRKFNASWRKGAGCISLIIGLIFVFSFSQLFTTAAQAGIGINRQINFQGKLVNNPASTNVTDTSYTVVFTLYDNTSGGTALWTETQSVTTSGGIFRVALGSVTPLPANFNFNWSGLYLGIKVNADAEMTPRIQMAAVPFAFNSEKVSGLTVQDTSGNASTSGTLQIANAKTVSFADAFTTSGAFPLTLTTTASTSITLPTTGTLLTNTASANQTITSTQTSGNILSLADSTGLTSAITGLTVGLTSSTNSQNKTGISFDLSGGSSGVYYDLLGTGSTWSITRAGVLSVASCSGCGGGTGVNWWNQLAGALSPVSINDDFLIGGTATSAAKFSYTGIQSGNTIASASGNFILMPNNGWGGKLGINTTSPVSLLNMRGGSADWSETTPGLTTGTFHLDPGNSTNNYGNAITFGASDDSAAGTAAQAGLYVRTDATFGSKMYFATTNNYTTGAQVHLVIDQLGDVQATAGNDLYVGVNRQSGKFAALQAGTSGSSFGFDSTGNFYIHAATGLNDYSIDTTHNLTFTGAGSFGFMGINEINPDAILDVNGTGDVQFNNTGNFIINTTTPTITTGINQNLIISPNGTGKIGIFTTSPLATLDVRYNSVAGGIISVASISGTTSFAALVANNNGVGDILTASKSGLALFTVKNNGQLVVGAPYYTATCTLKTDNTGLITCGTDNTGSGVNWWNQLAGALSPVSINDDFLIGGTASNAAKFSYTGIQSGNTIASISGQLLVYPNNGYGGNASLSAGLVLGANANPVIQTTKNQGLTIGGDTTGDIQFKPGNSSTGLYLQSTGNVGIGTTVPSVKLNVASSSNAVGILNEATDTGYTAIRSKNSAHAGYDYGIAGGGAAVPNAFYIFDVAQSATRLSINPTTGNISVGGIFTANAPLSFGTGAQTNKLYLYDNSNDKYGFGVATNTLQIYTGAGAGVNATIQFGKYDGTTLTEFARILNGRFGIGTTSPVAPLHVNSGYGSNAALIVNQLNSGDIFSASAAGTTKFTISNSGNITATGTLTGLTGLTLSSGAITLGASTGTTSDCLKGGATAAWGSCGTGSSSSSPFAEITGGVIVPNNSTVDFLIGGQATTAAKFAVLGVNTNQPIATVAGQFIVMPQNGWGGQLGIGTTTPNQALDVRGSSIFGNQLAYDVTAQPNRSKIIYSNELTTNTTNDIFSTAGSLEVNPAGATSRIYYGGLYNVISTSGNAQNFTGRLVGFQGQVSHKGTGTLTQARGFAGIITNDSTGIITDAFAGRFGNTNTSTGSYTNAYGVYILSPTNSGGGTFNTNYGLYVADQSNVGVVGSYNIWSDGFNSKNYFAGSVGIGATPSARLHVAGSWGSNAAVIIDQLNSGDLFAASASGITKFVITNGGSMNLVGGQTSDIDTLTATTLKIGTTNTNALTLGNSTVTALTFNVASGGNYVLQKNGAVFQCTGTDKLTLNSSGQLICSTDQTGGGSGVNWWNQLAGALSPVSINDDFLIGGTATSAAKFSYTGIQSGNTIASASGNLIVMPNNGWGGQVGIGTTTPNQALDVRSSSIFGNQQAFDITGVPNRSKIIYSNEVTTTTANDFFLAAGSLEVNPAGATSRSYLGALYNVVSTSTNAQNFTGQMVGVQGQVSHRGTGTLTTAKGTTGYTSNNNIGTITNAFAGKFGNDNASIGTITNGYGVYIASATNGGGGTYSNNYGLYVEDQSLVGSTSNYNLYSAGGGSHNYLAGNLGIGTTAVGNGQLVVNQTNFAGSSGDIFAASASGTTKFVIANSGTVTIGNSTDGLVFSPTGGGPTYSGTARPTKKITLSPEYAGAVLTASGSAAANGSMTSDASPSANFRTYYEWSSTQVSLNDYVVAVRVTLPADFGAWNGSTSMQISYNTESSVASTNKLDVFIYNPSTSTSVPVVYRQANVSTSWTTLNIANTDLEDSPAWNTAGQTATIYLKMYASGTVNKTRVGDITLNYLSKF